MLKFIPVFAFVILPVNIHDLNKILHKHYTTSTYLNIVHFDVMAMSVRVGGGAKLNTLPILESSKCFFADWLAEIHVAP